MKLLKNKRAESGADEQAISTNLLMGLVIAAMIILFTIPLWSKPLNLLFSNMDEDVAIQNFDRLVSAIENKEDSVYINLEKNYYIFGQAHGMRINFGAGYNTEQCNDMACLCLYDKNKMMKCEYYNDIYLFTNKVFSGTKGIFTDQESSDNYMNVKDDYNVLRLKDINKMLEIKYEDNKIIIIQ